MCKRGTHSECVSLSLSLSVVEVWQELVLHFFFFSSFSLGLDMPKKSEKREREKKDHQKDHKEGRTNAKKRKGRSTHPDTHTELTHRVNSRHQRRRSPQRLFLLFFFLSCLTVDDSRFTMCVCACCMAGNRPPKAINLIDTKLLVTVDHFTIRRWQTLRSRPVIFRHSKAYRMYLSLTILIFSV